MVRRKISIYRKRLSAFAGRIKMKEKIFDMLIVIGMAIGLFIIIKIENIIRKKK